MKDFLFLMETNLNQSSNITEEAKLGNINSFLEKASRLRYGNPLAIIIKECRLLPVFILLS